MKRAKKTTNELPKAKKVPKTSPAAKKAPEVSQLKLESGESAFSSFLGDDVTLEDFFENYWEKKPLVIKRKNNEKWIEYIKTLFSYDQLNDIVSDKKLKYGVDLNLCKLVDNKKHVFNKKEPNVKLAYLEDSFQKNKATIQFHQPQRFSVNTLIYFSFK